MNVTMHALTHYAHVIEDAVYLLGSICRFLKEEFRPYLQVSWAFISQHFSQTIDDAYMKCCMDTASVFSIAGILDDQKCCACADLIITNLKNPGINPELKPDLFVYLSQFAMSCPMVVVKYSDAI